MAASSRTTFEPPATPPRRTTSPTKRQRALSDVFGDEDGGGDHNATPRPQFAMVPPARPMFSMMPPASPAAFSSSSVSRSSGRSSPTKKSGGEESMKSGPAKHLTPFAHTPVTIKGKNLARPGDGVELPSALAGMVGVISRHARGLRVVSHVLRVKFIRNPFFFPLDIHFAQSCFVLVAVFMFFSFIFLSIHHVGMAFHMCVEG
jgi:hypothetical protein